jgi:hypothetical protein
MDDPEDREVIGLNAAGPMLSMLKPQLGPMLEKLIQSGPPETVAGELVPHLEGLINPALHPDAAEVLIHLGRRLQTRSEARTRAARRGTR